MKVTHMLRTVSAMLLATGLTSAATVPATAAAESCDGRAATIVVPPPPPDAFRTAPVVGTPGDDVIVGSAWPDTIDGAGGDDVICGRKGDDELLGGTGRDRLFGGLDGTYEPDEGYDGDLIEPGPGKDYVDLGHDPQLDDVCCGDVGLWDRVSYRHAAGGVEVDLAAGRATGEGRDTIAPIGHAAGIVGSAHDDVLLGTDHDDWIAAGAGDDVVEARRGFDVVVADDDGSGQGGGTGSGDDVVVGGRGRDVVETAGGADRVFGGPGPDQISLAEGERARGFGGGGKDWVIGGGRVRIDGGRGADRLQSIIGSRSDRVRAAGGAGRDVLDLDVAREVAPDGSRLVVGRPTGVVRVSGGPTLIRFASLEELHGWLDSSATVTWYGTSGDDVLDLGGIGGRVRAFGRGGDDRMRSGSGSDLLDGGAGRDRLEAGTGDDRCVRGERLRSCEAVG